jgi:hypothetical protein
MSNPLLLLVRPFTTIAAATANKAQTKLDEIRASR